MKKWSEEYSYGSDMQIPTFPDGGAVDIQFKCPKCGELIEVEQVEVPSPCMGDNDPTYGEAEIIECQNEDCKEEYHVLVYNNFTHWAVIIENKEPKKLQFANCTYKNGDDEE